MAGDTVRQIKDRLSIQDVVSQYVQLQRAGSTLRARCPFHAEKTPSFFVSAERGTYHCFGCGEGGDIFSFVEKIEGLDFKGALKVLADKAGVELVYERGAKGEKDERDRLFELMEAATLYSMARLDEAARSYLHTRGVEDGTIHAFRIGWAGNDWSAASDYLRSKKFSDKEIVDAGLAKKNERGSLVDKFRNRILFPIADSAGRVVAFSGRSFGAQASAEAPKYLNSPETPLFHKSRILYGMDRAKVSMRKAGCAVLVEGQMDLIMSHQAGWANTVAVSGTAFTEEHAGIIKRMTDNLVLALDADEAGMKAAARAARAALGGGLNVKVARLPHGLDPAELILSAQSSSSSGGKEEFGKVIRESKDIITFLLDVLEERSAERDKFRRAVETVVVPFIAEVQSPIAREHYVAEVAERLHVSANAVAETLAAFSRAAPQPRVAQNQKTKVPTEHASSRPQHAYAFLLWQESLEKPHVDLTDFRAELKESVDPNVLAAFAKLSDAEKETLRFTAERMWEKSRHPGQDAKDLLNALHRERARAELTEVAAALDKAEAEGKEAEAARLAAKSKLLTREIARLHEGR